MRTFSRNVLYGGQCRKKAKEKKKIIKNIGKMKPASQFVRVLDKARRSGKKIYFFSFYFLLVLILYIHHICHHQGKMQLG